MEGPHPPMFRMVDCLSLPVADLEAALEFYQGLGHELIWRTDTSAGLRLPECEAELVLQTERPHPETDLVVTSIDDDVARFVQAGGRIINGPFDIAIGRCVVVADPWDNVLVLLDRTKGRFSTDADGRVIGLESR